MQSQLTYAVDGLAFTVSFDRWDSLKPHRTRWYWSISETVLKDGVFAATGEVLARGDDLTTYAPRGVNAVEAMQSFGVFLDAWVEAIESGRSDSHNANLFPDVLLKRVDIGTWRSLIDQFNSELSSGDDN